MKATPAGAAARRRWYRRHRAAVLLVQKFREAGRVIPIAQARAYLAQGVTHERTL
jgi:hypothetical protein